MVEKTLEFRGIKREHICTYLTEMGGNQVTFTFPLIYDGLGWRVQLLNEKELSFTAAFKVNAVDIRFEALNMDILDEIIRNFRLKTFRAGG